MTLDSDELPRPTENPVPVSDSPSTRDVPSGKQGGAGVGLAGRVGKE